VQICVPWVAHLVEHRGDRESPRFTGALVVALERDVAAASQRPIESGPAFLDRSRHRRLWDDRAAHIAGRSLESEPSEPPTISKSATRRAQAPKWSETPSDRRHRLDRVAPIRGLRDARRCPKPTATFIAGGVRSGALRRWRIPQAPGCGSQSNSSCVGPVSARLSVYISMTSIVLSRTSARGPQAGIAGVLTTGTAPRIRASPSA